MSIGSPGSKSCELRAARQLRAASCKRARGENRATWFESCELRAANCELQAASVREENRATWFESCKLRAVSCECARGESGHLVRNLRATSCELRVCERRMIGPPGTKAASCDPRPETHDKPRVAGRGSVGRGSRVAGRRIASRLDLLRGRSGQDDASWDASWELQAASCQLWLICRSQTASSRTAEQNAVATQTNTQDAGTR